MLEEFSQEVQLWIDSWPDGLIAANDNHYVEYISPEASRVLGWSVSDTKGKTVHELLCATSRSYLHSPEDCPLCHPLESAKVNSTVWKSRGGFNIGVDCRIIAIKGSRQVNRLLSFQNNYEAEYSQNELEKYAEYVDKNPEPIVEFDGSGQMMFSNTAMQDQLLDKGFDDLGAPLIYPENLSSLCLKCREDKEVIRDVDVQVGDSWYRWQFHPMKSGGEVSVMGYAFDITEQKEMELRIELEKAEARRDFFAKMVHELRTPLNAIIGFSQVLLRRVEGVVPAREYGHLESIRTAGLQLNEMISDTLDISKIDAGKMSLEIERFSLNGVLDSFSTQVQGLAEGKGLIYDVDCQVDVWLCSDLNKVRQILINLISNAIKYTPTGHVQVTVMTVEDPELGDCAQIDVTDSGIGIPQEEIGALFRAYQQVSEVKNKGIQGTGLGLALVSELTDMLKGRIDVFSVPGTGSTFAVILPLEL